MVDSRAGSDNIPNDPRTSFSTGKQISGQKAKKGGISKEHRSQIEESMNIAGTAFTIKYIVLLDYKPMYKTSIHESILI